MAFDGDYTSARKLAFPKIIQRGLPVSLYYNPGLSRYAAGIDFWETVPNRYGWFLGHHQMECKQGFWDRGSMTDAYYQAGEAARIIWSINPPGKTQLHQMTEWVAGDNAGLDSAQWAELQGAFHFLRAGTVGGSYLMPTDTWTYAQLIARPQSAITNGSFVGLLFHQIGPYGEYSYVVNETYFEQFLDWLVANSNSLWIGNDMEIYSYTQEYNTRIVTVTATSPDITVNLTSSKDPSLYTYPLTLITQVPSTWTYCRVTQGTGASAIDAKKTYPVAVWASSRTVMYEAVPGWGTITLENSAMDVSSPAAVSVRDGITAGYDIDAATATDYLAANWTQSSDAETGIRKYWYKIGITPNGGELMDWIDNGTYTYVNVTRTHLSLVRGTTYYFTVRAENGQGYVSPEAHSDGQCVDILPGYIKFAEDFETGSAGKWDSAAPGITIDASTSVTGSYCLKAALSGGNGTVVKKDNINNSNDMYLSFWFKLGPNFTMDSYRVNIMSIKTAAGTTVAQMFINCFAPSMYLLTCEFITDDAKYPTIPEGLADFAPGVLPHIDVDKWYRFDVHTKADYNRKGGVELWLNGVKEASYLEKHTGTKAASGIQLGAVSVSSTAAGDIYFDDIMVSDSLMKAFAQANVGASTAPAPGPSPAPAPSVTDSVKAYPNPCSLSSGQPVKFVVRGNTGGEVKIYTMQGKLVRKLSVPAGQGTINWDGTNADGQKAVRGVYLFKATDEAGSRAGKLALIK